MTPAEHVGARVRERRTAAGISIRSLGRAARMDRCNVVRLERGDMEPRLSTLVRVASALGCDVAHLVAGLGAP